MVKKILIRCYSFDESYGGAALAANESLTVLKKFKESEICIEGIETRLSRSRSFNNFISRIVQKVLSAILSSREGNFLYIELPFGIRLDRKKEDILIDYWYSSTFRMHQQCVVKFVHMVDFRSILSCHHSIPFKYLSSDGESDLVKYYIDELMHKNSLRRLLARKKLRTLEETAKSTVYLVPSRLAARAIESISGIINLNYRYCPFPLNMNAETTNHNLDKFKEKKIDLLWVCSYFHEPRKDLESVLKTLILLDARISRKKDGNLRRLSVSLIGKANRDTAIKIASLQSVIRNIDICHKKTVSKSKLLEIFDESHLCLSNSHQDIFGLTIPQSMSRSCIPIATHTTGAVDIINNKINGFTFDGDCSSLCDIIYNILGSSDLELMDIARNAFMTSRKLLPSVYCETLMDIVNKPFT